MRMAVKGLKIGAGLGVIFTSFLIITAGVMRAQDVRTFVSSKAGDRLTAKAVLQFAQRQNSGNPKFTIHEETAYQKIDGFGASFLEAGLICLNDLPQEERESVLRALFDPEKGAGSPR